MRVIFLDFDGVIVTAHTRYHRGDPWCIFWLNDLIKKTEAKIVVSSMWRTGRTVEELRALLKKWGVKAEVIDRTPFLSGSTVRGAEIAHWLNSRSDVESFVILDDDADMAELMPRLVRTDVHHGMDGDDAKKAVEMLLHLKSRNDGELKCMTP